MALGSLVIPAMTRLEAGPEPPASCSTAGIPARRRGEASSYWRRSAGRGYPRRYIFTVHALDDSLGLDDVTSRASFVALNHTNARVPDQDPQGHAHHF